VASKFLVDPSSSVRELSLQLLSKLQNQSNLSYKECKDLLLRQARALLKHGQYVYRATLASGLARLALKDKDLRELFMLTSELARDKVANVRLAWLKGLLELGPRLDSPTRRDSHSLVMQLLNDPDCDVQFYAEAARDAAWW
jgi:hypothetical protein